jgi:transcriptional regulator with XRE-family HTH domain
MGRRAKALTPGTSARDGFGADLRSWRTARGMTHRDLARLICYSQELVAKVERGHRWPSSALAAACDSVLETGGALAALWPAVEHERLAADGRRKPQSQMSAA